MIHSPEDLAKKSAIHCLKGKCKKIFSSASFWPISCTSNMQSLNAERHFLCTERMLLNCNIYSNEDIFTEILYRWQQASLMVPSRCQWHTTQTERNLSKNQQKIYWKWGQREPMKKFSLENPLSLSLWRSVKCPVYRYTNIVFRQEFCTFLLSYFLFREVGNKHKFIKRQLLWEGKKALDRLKSQCRQKAGNFFSPHPSNYIRFFLSSKSTYMWI